MSRQPADRHSTGPARRVVVIGGGIAGLATAALLARDGHQVDLLEQRDDLGGRAGSWEAGGFRFDTGPSWYLMPEVFDHFFGLLGTSTAEQLDLATLDPGYRVFFPDHPPVDVHQERARNVATFEAIEPGAGARLERYLDSAADAYDVALRHFLYTSFDSPRWLLNRRVLTGGPRLAALMARSLERFVAGQFTDRRLRQILGYPAVFLGSSPARTPALYHLMSHLDLDDGVRYPMGGFTRLIDVVAGLAHAHGARLHTGVRVTGITTTYRSRRPHVTGVTYSDGAASATLPADLVVAAADLHHVETQLLPAALRSHPQRWWDRRDPGPGAVLAYLGVRGRVPQLPHHALFFTADWRANFEAIFGRERHAPDPASTYVCTPSRTDPTVAPPGDENLFLLVPVPADVSLGHGGVDGAGSPAVEAVADRAIDQVAAWAGVADLRERIVVRRTVGPADFAVDLNAWAGGMLGPAHTLRQTAMLRARNVSTTVDGLLYAGASTIPGVGLPMCLISAELVLARVRGDRSVGPLPLPDTPARPTPTGAPLPTPAGHPLRAG